MSNYREIVTKTVLGKGKKTFVTEHTITPEHIPTTILGCWVINHNFSGKKENNKVVINGDYDVNIWYSYDDDRQTEVIKQTNSYQETVNIKNNDNSSNTDVIVRSLSDPSCSNVKIEGNAINYKITEELGIELVGDTKVRISTIDEEEPWDDIMVEEDLQQIEEEVNEDSIKDAEILDNED